eukprot:PLAT7084.4.p4 GENE.PLAT7084.4~~PLAT7084.4.p4  ORF type:complete len:141 (+),score=91.25 PLAT7084.4:36-425(+)
MDQYGNYVVQHVLEHGRPHDRSELLPAIRRKLLRFSQHKFASNVVERALQHCSTRERTLFVEEMLRGDALLTMMKDPYANYVVQKLLDVCNDTQRGMLVEKVAAHAAMLRKFSYGKHILAFLAKLGHSL